MGVGGEPTGSLWVVGLPSSVPTSPEEPVASQEGWGLAQVWWLLLVIPVLGKQRQRIESSRPA
jgi:hypothetical protein